MKRWIYRIVAGLVLAGFILTGQWFFLGESESADSGLPAAWQSMTVGELRIEGSSTYLNVRIADEPAERAQGMQHLPARVVRDHPIWFVFDTPRRTGWHMQNVKIPLDIIYVDETGTVIGMQRMEPNTSGYGINAPITAALEVAAGQAEALGIREGTRLTLTSP